MYGRAVRGVGVVVLTGVVAMVGPALAATARPKNHHFELTAVFRALTSHGESFTATGTISGSPFGQGAIVRHVNGAGAVISVGFTWFAVHGSVSGTATERRTAGPNGSVNFTVTNGQILSGAGRYHGATGTFSGTGTWPSPINSNPVTEHLNGTVRY